MTIYGTTTTRYHEIYIRCQCGEIVTIYPQQHCECKKCGNLHQVKVIIDTLHNTVESYEKSLDTGKG